MNPLLCFHCGEPLLGSTVTARINGRDEAVCCQGCRAVAELIGDVGLSDYYLFRETSSARPDEAALARDAWAAYARPEIAAQFTRRSGDTESVTLAIDGMRCAACSWLIDKVLQLEPAVTQVSTNASTGRAHVSWDSSRLTLADILRTIARLGYRPCPLGDDQVQQLQQREQRTALKRLAVAGLGMMQVMMFAVASYSAHLSGESIEPGLLEFFRLVSLLVATPVMAYAGAPIFAGALQSLRRRTVGMDVPVAIALVLAYGASVWNALRGNRNEVYFDSVTMFVFFLTLGRFVQMSVRHRMTGVSDALARQLPAAAHRVDGKTIEDVPVSALRRGDPVLVRAGEVIPVDGELVAGMAAIDEAMLTGESLPVQRSPGESVAAGTLNCLGPIYVRVTETAAGTVISHIVSLLQRAQAQKPAVSRAADAAAARFLLCVILGAALTFALWLAFDPTQAFAATLAVLVVACPCAFAIAMPAALSAATARLAHGGVLVTNPDALETLARVDRIVFDKTGTLTRGVITVGRCVALADISEAQCLQIAASIELASEHPLARAFVPSATCEPARDVRTVAGCGVEGVVNDRRYRVGTDRFVADLRGEPGAEQTLADMAGTLVTLGDERQALALFDLRDAARTSAPAAIESLRKLNVSAQILSGDSQQAVGGVAAHCGITDYFARRSPVQKLAHVQQLQREGHCVAMMGDGVNDAPVLAGADVSIAMGRGAALAHASADMILVGDNLGSLADAICVARRSQRIARQNMIWSAFYNLGSLPLAALGFIPPWLAALGMSLSSIAVLLNTTRLLPRAQPPMGIGDSPQSRRHDVSSAIASQACAIGVRS